MLVVKDHFRSEGRGLLWLSNRDVLILSILTILCQNSGNHQDPINGTVVVEKYRHLISLFLSECIQSINLSLLGE